MLTRTLRNLESTGLILRRVTGSKPIAVEYSLSKLGSTIIAPLKTHVPLGKTTQKTCEC
jgi:DNA-binding HxlR family transcriptional regulator